MEEENRFALGFYFRALTGMLKEPRRFFSEMPENMGMKKPLVFLMVSGFLSTVAGLITAIPENPFFSGGIYFRFQLYHNDHADWKTGDLCKIFQHICFFYRDHSARFMAAVFFLDHRTLEMVANRYWNDKRMRIQQTAYSSHHMPGDLYDRPVFLVCFAFAGATREQIPLVE